MDALIIESTEISPKVVFEPEKPFFEISGESRPENVRKFYEPIIEWLNDFGNALISKQDQNQYTFNFRFEYFNSSSAKFIMDILKKLEDIYTKGINMEIKWYYDEGDEDMQETGEEFSKIIDVPFEYIEVAE